MAAPSAASRTSPSKIAAPTSSVTVLPSTRDAVTLPSTVSTRPIGCAETALSCAWAYCSGFSAPAKRTARSPSTRSPLSEIRSGGVSVAKKSRISTCRPSLPISSRSGPSRIYSALTRNDPPGTETCAAPAESRITRFCAGPSIGDEASRWVSCTAAGARTP